MTEPRRRLEFAREDLVLAEAALEKIIYNQVCFHAQQGVEKTPKGFLRAHQRSVPKTHILSELLSLCRGIDGSFSRLEETGLKLDRYYIPTRYPDALPGAASEGLPARRDAEEAVELVRDALEWVRGRVA